MPVSPTYPGVYVQELPSGSRTIVGVSTSITAFVGRALRGPTNDPTRVSSFADFGRKFGGLWAKSPLTYAVQQYFLAGGKEALIVRVTDTTVGDGSAVEASASLSLENTLRLRAQNAIAATHYGNDYTLEITHDGGNELRFTLVLTDEALNTEEYYVSLTSADADAAAEEDDCIYIGDLPARLGAGSIAEVLTLPYGRPGLASPGEPFTGGSVSGSAVTAAICEVAGDAYPGVDLPEATAYSAGVWGNQLRITVDYLTSDPDDDTLFNFKVEELDTDANVVTSEVYRNVTMDPDGSRYLPTLLEEESQLVTLGPYPYVRLATVTRAPLTAGSDGGAITAMDILGSSADQTGIYALELADLFNLLVLPPPSFEEEFEIGAWATPLAYCETRRAVCLVDAPSTWTASTAEGFITSAALSSEYGAIYFPWVKIADPLKENRLATFPPCGVVAGLVAKTDGQRGVWKAPAGLDARAPIIRGLAVKLTDSENGTLNPLGLNCLRTFPNVGSVVWGARTTAGADRLASDWKYLPVRRLALYIEESLYRGLQWAVFEPNDEPLWSQIRLSAGGFMHQLFRQGAFKGATPKDAYFVKCDADTTTDADVDRGIVNVLIGFAPLKPAEFVVISIQQIAGQVSA